MISIRSCSQTSQGICSQTRPGISLCSLSGLSLQFRGLLLVLLNQSKQDKELLSALDLDCLCHTGLTPWSVSLPFHRTILLFLLPWSCWGPNSSTFFSLLLSTFQVSTFSVLSGFLPIYFSLFFFSTFLLSTLLLFFCFTFLLFYFYNCKKKNLHLNFPLFHLCTLYFCAFVILYFCICVPLYFLTFNILYFCTLFWYFLLFYFVSVSLLTI